MSLAVNPHAHPSLGKELLFSFIEACLNCFVNFKFGMMIIKDILLHF